MIEIAHSIPGRLRLVVRDRRSAPALLAAARDLTGVTATTLNSVTGSLVILYDGQAISAGDLYEALRRSVAVPTPTPVIADADQAVEAKLIAMAVDACLRYVFERSAAMLLGAVI
jgi:hypothetical protein